MQQHPEMSNSSDGRTNKSGFMFLNLIGCFKNDNMATLKKKRATGLELRSKCVPFSASKSPGHGSANKGKKGHGRESNSGLEGHSHSRYHYATVAIGLDLDWTKLIPNGCAQ